MLFDVMFQIDVDDAQDAADEVATWTVAPGALLKFIIASQPIVVMQQPTLVPMHGRPDVRVNSDPMAPPEMQVPTQPEMPATRAERQAAMAGTSTTVEPEPGRKS